MDSNCRVCAPNASSGQRVFWPFPQAAPPVDEGPSEIEADEPSTSGTGPSTQQAPLSGPEAQQQRVFQEVARRLNERLTNEAAAAGVAAAPPVTEDSVRQALASLAKGGPQALPLELGPDLEAAVAAKQAEAAAPALEHRHGECSHCEPAEAAEAQGCWEMYQRAYLRYLTIAWPPLYVALVALLMTLQVLGFIAAFFLAPIGFVLSTSFCLTKGKLKEGGLGLWLVKNAVVGVCLLAMSIAAPSSALSITSHLLAVGGLKSTAIPTSSFPAATVVSLEVAAILTFAQVRWCGGNHGVR